jgi:hypothetical protein
VAILASDLGAPVFGWQLSEAGHGRVHSLFRVRYNPEPAAGLRDGTLATNFGLLRLRADFFWNHPLADMGMSRSNVY